MYHWIFALMLLLGVSSVVADEGEAILQPPTLPTPVQSGEPLEPDVNITTDDRGEVHEYRVNGKLYMVKIIPSAGPAYYLIDQDGDGTLESERNGLERPQVPQWIIFSW